MNIPSKELREINELIELALDNSISPEQSQRLHDLIIHNPAVRRHYCEYIHLTVGVERLNVKIPAANLHEYDTLFDQELWSQLAYEEKTAPVIEVPQEQPQPELIRKVVYPSREKRSISKFSIFMIFNAAAVLLLLLLLQFVPPEGVEVVTLADSLNAKWADVGDSMQNGTRFHVDSTPLLLRKGFAELIFDNNASVTIEGPAEFQILAEDRIGLNYGKVYATVPKEAIGFSVYTQNAKIIDMGTEFGVQAESHGDTKLHVLKGKTMLMAGEKANKVTVEVGKGVAKRISGDTQTVSDISCNEIHFVRAFDSQSNVVWRKQPSLDLADMVRAGNGLGTGNSKVRLDPVEGFTEVWHGAFRVVKGYLPISNHPFIDGIFIPDGDTPQIVSSRGDVFEECPDTSGVYSMDLLANPRPEIFKTEHRGTGTIRFDGQEYTDESGKSCIVMHANHGLTFDLEAMRRSYKRDIIRFTSQIGIADLKENCSCNADFWVLVDGQVRYSLRQYKQKGVLNDVAVEIKSTDRFLTLVSTDGSDPDYPKKGFYERAISCDWCIFTEPVLVLE